MNFLELFASAIAALRSNLMRTILTMLGIIIGIMSVIVIIALGQGASASITTQISSLGSNLLTISPGSDQRRGPQSDSSANLATLTYADAQAITQQKQALSIEAVSAVVSKYLPIVANGQNTSVPVYGISEEYEAVQSIEMNQGSWLHAEDETSVARVAVVGPDVVTTLFGEQAAPVGQSIRIDGKPFVVIGVTKSKGSSGFTNPDNAVYIPITTEMKVFLGQNNVQSIQVSVIDPNKTDTVISSLKQLLLDRHRIDDPTKSDFSILSSKDALSTLGTVTGILTAALAGIAGISLLVGGIGIMNIMLVTVTERTKEIGLLKAIGAKRRDILIQFLIESIALTLVGGAIGILLGIGLSFLAAKLIAIPFIIRTYSLFLAAGVSIVIGVIFGLYPAQRAAKLSPIDALRYE